MFEKIGQKVYNWAISSNPWTNVYGFARSLLAIAMAITLVFNEAQIFFRPVAGADVYPNCSGNISIFCMVPNDYFSLNFVKWIVFILLLVIASGWRPNVTGIIHWWIAYSMQVSAVTIDGGEQVAAVLTLLLIPITLTDHRTWHWQKAKDHADLYSNKFVYFRIIALCSLIAIRVQVAIIYFHSSIAKMYEPTWIDGTAVYYFLQDPMLGMNSFFLQLVKPILTSPAVVILTWGTLLLQIFLFGALFASRKYWKYYLVVALLLHETIAIMLGLISFSIVMTGALILYLNPVNNEFKFIYKIKKYFNSVGLSRIRKKFITENDPMLDIRKR
ncbi:sporulation-delaying protein SdpB family protein [Baia soyae]|uniref:Antimicrobial peptide system SdpB family protein n=1 Tax=Baia soyae TaxID=1544746 RepID=A0A4R2RQU5_9BACL|nr:sporulation-delaying protein SdpB family protein [Baia soyae]TCP61545.1 antimicrobial peptide system SdpB family protein [Baia soyae]